LLGLSRTAVGSLVDELLDSRLVHLAGQDEGSVGRPAALIEFDPRSVLALGADLVDNAWQIVAIDLDAQVTDVCSETCLGSSPEAAVEALKAGVSKLKGRAGAARVLPAIGLGTPGRVDVRSGIIRSATEYDWTDVPIRDMVADTLGMETLIANRGKVGALAELWHTRGEDKDIIFIFIGRQVDAGIAHDGELYLGSSSCAGDLGHVTVLPDGPLCQCGNRGCLQELVSGPAIERLARARLRDGASSLSGPSLEAALEDLSVETIFEAAEAGDPLAREVVDEVAGYLGIAIANLVNLFNPELITLGGPIGENGQVLIEPLKREVSRRAMPYSLGMVTIASSDLGAQAGSMGAAVLVLQQAGRLLFANH
jgi:predicted NBD/HSP70 family sugar kinase